MDEEEGSPEAIEEPPYHSTLIPGTSDRCRKVQVVNESHARWRDRRLADVLRWTRHDSCGGRPGIGLRWVGQRRVSSGS